jgi:hypothetical protein
LSRSIPPIRKDNSSSRSCAPTLGATKGGDGAELPALKI